MTNPLCNDCRYYKPLFPGYCSHIPGERPTIAQAREPYRGHCGPEAKFFELPIPKPGLGYVEAGR